MLSLSAFSSVAATVVDLGAPTVDPRVIDLMEQARGGSTVAFAELYDRYVDRVYGFILRRVGDHALAEDLTADVFTRMLRSIDTFTYKGKDPIAWLLTIARNRVHDHFRSGRFRLEQTTELSGMDLADPGPQPSAGLERSAVVAEVRAALTKLKPDHAEVLHLRFVEELSVTEVAQLLGRREGAVRALQFRALKALATHVDAAAVMS